MNKIKLVSLLLCCTILISACGEKEKTQPATLTSTPLQSGTEKEASTEAKSSENTPSAEKDTSNWLREAEFSENKPFHFPWLNEELFGILASEFNNEMKEIYEEIKFSLEEDEFAEEYAELTRYETATDPETGTFSVVFQFPFLGKYMGYRTMAIDLENKQKLSFSDFIARYDYTEQEVKESIIRYHDSMYKRAAEDFGYETLWDSEEYLRQRVEDVMLQINEKPDPSVGEPYELYYGLSGGKPSIYVISQFPVEEEPFASNKYYVPIKLRKNLTDFAVENAQEHISATLIRQATPEEIQQTSPIQMIETENASKEDAFLLIATKDNVEVNLYSLIFDDKENTIKKSDPYYTGKLQKGQSLLVYAIEPEGMPYVLLELKDQQKIDGTEYTFELQRPFYFNGAFPDPKIEYLETTMDSQ